MSGEKLCKYICICTAAAGIAICAFFSIPSAAVILIVSMIIIGAYEYINSVKRKKLMSLCDDIDRILRGIDFVNLNDYKENEVSLLAAEVQKMTLRLREQNTALSNEKKFLKESLEDIAHQLRTPLTSMMLLIETIGNPSLSDKHRSEYIKELYKLLSRMKWLIDTMLGLSRIDAGVVKFKNQPIKCWKLIDDALAPLLISMDIKNISVDLKIENDPTITGDEHYLTEALVNIFKNCVEHTPEGGSLTIISSENPIYTGIVIKDSGEGFTEEEMPHIFERFYRSGDPAKSGYGIGLAFARRIVSSQGGSLQAGNAPEGGAMFDLRMYQSRL